MKDSIHKIIIALFALIFGLAGMASTYKRWLAVLYVIVGIAVCVWALMSAFVGGKRRDDDRDNGGDTTT